MQGALTFQTQLESQNQEDYTSANGINLFTANNSGSNVIQSGDTTISAITIFWNDGGFTSNGWNIANMSTGISNETTNIEEAFLTWYNSLNSNDRRTVISTLSSQLYAGCTEF